MLTDEQDQIFYRRQMREQAVSILAVQPAEAPPEVIVATAHPAAVATLESKPTDTPPDRGPDPVDQVEQDPAPVDPETSPPVPGPRARKRTQT